MVGGEGGSGSGGGSNTLVCNPNYNTAVFNCYHSMRLRLRDALAHAVKELSVTSDELGIVPDALVKLNRILVSSIKT